MRNEKSPAPQRIACQRRQLGIICLLIIILFSSCSLGLNNDNNTPPPTPEFACATPTSNPVTIKWLYESEEQPWVDKVVKDFNNSQTTACDGPITVQATPMGTGQAMQQILRGEQQPDIWSPASSAWLPLLNARWHQQHGSDLFSSSPGDTPPILTSPVVIAMWKSEAQATGWPGTPFGWNDLANFIANPQSWKQLQAGTPDPQDPTKIDNAHPEWGQFRFGNTSASYSGVGLGTAVDLSYAAACNAGATSDSTSSSSSGITFAASNCKQSGLTADDVNNANAKHFLSTIEASIARYGSDSSAQLAQMASQGYSSFSAVAADENQIFALNDKTKYPHLPSPIVGIYPKEGTVANDYPFAVLQDDSATLSKTAAARAFRDFLLDPAQQSQANTYGFRQADGTVDRKGLFDGNHGVDTTLSLTILPLPDPNVVQAIQTNWQQERRQFAVGLVVDRSGSMSLTLGGMAKIDGAKTALKQFVNVLGDQDQLGITTFNNRIDNPPLTDMTAVGPKRQYVLSRIDGIFSDGGALLYDSIKQEFQVLQKQPASSVRALIVLSNEPDNGSSTSLSQLLSLITLPNGQDVGQIIRIFTIAYGSGADANALTQIAAQTGGQEFSATPQNLQDVYEQIGEQL